MNDFGRLLEKEIPRLRRYARALTHDVSRADDLVQDPGHPRQEARKSGSHVTLRWREMDSNHRYPVKRTTLFETLLSQHARTPPPPSKTTRRPVQQPLLPVVDPVRMNAELTRQLGDRPVPPTAAAATPSL
jgi:hypothetical protein